MLARTLAFALSALPFSANAHDVTSIPLEAHDGVTLTATYYAANEAGPGLLFLNMCDPARDQTAWKNVASALTGHGYHVLTFDYRGFGSSGGSRPSGLSSIHEAMPYWRENWMSDVQIAYDTLVSQEGVSAARMGIAGASCGVFMGLEFMLENANITSLALLGGPTDTKQRAQLAGNDTVPILLISGDERGPNEVRGTLEWSEDVFAVSAHSDTRFMKYRTVTHGTNIFEHHPETEKMVVDWFLQTVKKD
jgi:alpha/beta superfamily hydrolase